MRDLVLLTLLPLMLYAMIKRPFIALGMWIWTAMFFPNAWVYGIASALRYNLLFTAVAIFGYLTMRNKPKVEFGLIGGFAIFFFVWATITTIMTIGNPDAAWFLWNRFAKIFLLFVFVVLVIEKKLHIDFFLGCVVLSIGFYGALEALKFIASGGGHKIVGFAGHVLGDRNELSLAFVMTLPICYYLLGEYAKQSRAIKYGLVGLMGLLVAAIIGTQSRGGFIAMVGLAAYLFVKSDRKILMTFLSLVLVAVLSQYISEDWTSRMDTIGEAGEDESFMGRLIAWKLSFILAVQNPFFGGGFKSLENFAVWSQLSRDFFAYPIFPTGDALPNPELPRAAHSVYFQVMGDHGFAGLAIYLGFVGSAFMKAASVAKRARQHVEAQWIASLASMLQLCIFSFCLGGAALSFAYFELLFAICGIVIVLDQRILPGIVSQKLKAAQAAKLAPGAVLG